VTAWTRGQLALDNPDLGVLMRQISRWYDVDVVFEGPVPDVHVGGVITRTASLSTVLEFLGENGVHYTTRGKTILISR
jgi:ferric-dicitrate binding protein FerR (iron transport regulator)